MQYILFMVLFAHCDKWVLLLQTKQGTFLSTIIIYTIELTLY